MNSSKDLIEEIENLEKKDNDLCNKFRAWVNFSLILLFLFMSLCLVKSSLFFGCLVYVMLFVIACLLVYSNKKILKIREDVKNLKRKII